MSGGKGVAAVTDLSELCECLGIPEKNYMRAKNSLWWDRGHFVKEVGMTGPKQN